MDQISQLMSTHNAAMNAQMSKYTDKLMIGESIARKKDQLLDSAGMELIQAGLGSGRLGKLGSHLLKHALGVNALKHGGAVVDAVRAHQRGGVTGVVSHFATQRPGLAQSVLRGILPNGQADALQSHIRATFANPAAAARALGADHEAGMRARMAAVRASGSSRATSASEEGRSVAERGTAAWRTLKSKGASLFSNATSRVGQGTAAAAAAAEKARLAARRVGSANFADAARDAASGAADAATSAASSVVDTASSAASGAADAATSAASSVVDTATSAATSGTAAARGAADRAASLAQESAGGAAARSAAIAAAARDAAELQARVLQERKEALAKQAGALGAATKEGAESTTAAVADERERVIRRAPEAAPKLRAAIAAGKQQITDGARAEGSSVADTMAASVDRSQGIGGFANTPEEEARLRASAAPKESTLPDGGLDRSGNPIPKPKPRPAYRLPAIRQRVVDPVQEKLARTLKVKGIQDRLVKARADYAASQSATSAAAESSRISSWRVPRPSAGPATIRNAALDGGSQLVRSVGSVNSGIDLRRNLSLPTFEEATAAVKSAPQRLLQHLNRRVFGGVAPPSTSANYAASRPKIDFSQELPTLPTFQARAAIVQPEVEDLAPENDGLDYNSLSFENFGFGGGKFEDD